MEIILFIKLLLKKSKKHPEIWLPILYDLQEYKKANICKSLTVSERTQLRIIDFGIELFNKTVPKFKIERNRKKLVLLDKKQKKSNEILISKEIEEKPILNSKNQQKEIEVVELIEEKEVVNENLVHENILSYLNEKSGNVFRISTKLYKDLIDEKFKLGYKIEDFYIVIDNKTNDWLGTEFQKYLRPQTLFGDKFDGYLNQKSIITNSQNKAYDTVNKATKLGWGSKN
jgi:uncharacterized phage protein (TIGR02220 family)